MKYLVDTDWAIENLHGREPVVSLLDKLAEDGLGLSVASLAELYEGVYYSRDPQSEDRALQDFLSAVQLIQLDDEICRLFAQHRGRLRATGTLIGDLDILIGCTAIRYGLTLLTNNRRHFERLPGLDILSA